MSEGILIFESVPAPGTLINDATGPVVNTSPALTVQSGKAGETFPFIS
jgi:hypothetical protein